MKIIFCNINGNFLNETFELNKYGKTCSWSLWLNMVDLVSRNYSISSNTASQLNAFWNLKLTEAHKYRSHQGTLAFIMFTYKASPYSVLSCCSSKLQCLCDAKRVKQRLKKWITIYFLLNCRGLGEKRTSKRWRGQMPHFKDECTVNPFQKLQYW